MRKEDLSYFEDDEFKEALNQYETALREGRGVYMDADDLTDIAEYYMVKEREQEAMDCIQLAREIHPDAVDPQIFLARQQLFHNNIEKAQEMASAIPDQRDREVVFLWMEIYLKQGRCTEADGQAKLYYRTLHEDRDQFLYDTAGVFMDYEQWGTALKWAEKLQKEFPKTPTLNMLMGEILLNLYRNEEAIRYLNKVIQKEPFNVDAWEMLVEAEMNQENYREAVDAADYLLAINEKHMNARFLRGQSLYQLHQFEEAHEQYLSCLEDRPQDVGVLYWDGEALAGMERYEEALDQLQKAENNCTDGAVELPEIYMERSFILSKLKKPEEAIEALNTCYDLDEKKRDFNYQMLLAHIYLENGNREEAEKCFDKAKRTTRTPLVTKLVTAITWCENDYFAEALPLFEQLLQSDLSLKEAHCYPYMAYCMYFLKDPRYPEYLTLASEYNPRTTEDLFSPIRGEES